MWAESLLGDRIGVDGQKGGDSHVAHLLGEEECQRILLTCKQPKYAPLLPVLKIALRMEYEGPNIGF
jgi:hypothetical protein